jgi:oligoendopeptidase F
MRPKIRSITLPVVSLALMTASVSAKPETRNRAEIPAEYKWDFTPIYASWEAWEAGIKDMEAKMAAFPALKGTLSKGPAEVVKAYQLFDEIGQLQYRVYRYPQLQRDVDTRNNEIAGKLQRVQAIFAKFGTATSWFTPELLTIPQATMEKWIAETPALAPYKFPILDNYRQQEHVLDEKGEKLLSFASRFSQTPTSVFQELSTSDIKFPTVTLSDGKEVKLSPGAYQHVLQTNRNQADRKLAFETYHKTYEANINTYAAIYNGVLQRDWFSAQARNYPTTLDDALDGNAIPKAVVENLIETTRAGTEPFRRYMRLRKKLLGLETYNPFDNFIPIYDVEKKYPYELATELALKSVEPLGAEYVEKYKKFVSGGRIDVYENDGKRSGAYCAGVYGVGPYLLLNHNETLDSVFTFAHEAGHAMHTVLSYETQPFVTSSYTIFVAEVASTTNERFLLNQFLETTTDPKERFVLLQHAVDAIVGTFYTQVLFADYELQAHRLVEEGKPVTAEVLSGIYKQLLKDYYVYQYATCFASSAQIFKTLTTGSAEEKKAATERYLTLLRSGGNDHPMEQLKKAGVDLTKKETVQAVVDQMNELVAQLEAEAAKIK